MTIQSGFPTCPERLNDAQLQELRENGYIAFEDGLETGEIEEANRELSAIVDRYRANPDQYLRDDRGSVTHFKRKDSPTVFQLEAAADLAAGDIELMIRKYMWFEDEAPIFQRLCSEHPKTRGVVDSVFGESAVLYQSMALVKPPKIGVEKPWHQDNAYFSIDNLDGVLGSWIALDEATVENGCMHFIPGGHRLGPLLHHHDKDCEIVPGRIDTDSAVAIELPPGGIIFFHGNIPHFTPQNSSDRRRRAIQYHYRSEQTRVIPTDEYYDIFCESDGTPASCAAIRRQGI